MSFVSGILLFSVLYVIIDSFFWSTATLSHLPLVVSPRAKLPWEEVDVRKTAANILLTKRWKKEKKKKDTVT